MGLFSTIFSPVKSVIGEFTGANDANDALNQSNQIAGQNADKSLALQNKMYTEGVARSQPFYETGVNANNALNKMLYGGYDINQSPAAQYQLTQGTRSLNRQLAARGLLGSGNAAQRYAELESGVKANDWNNQWSRLLSAVNVGTGSASSMNSTGSQNAALGTSTLGNLSNNISNNNNARAQLYTNTSLVHTLGDIAGAAGSMQGAGGL